jgi:hypothetical protein
MSQSTARLNIQLELDKALLEPISSKPIGDLETLLKAGANPNTFHANPLEDKIPGWEIPAVKSHSDR